uniref:Integrase catalytic domain-containing protein n=1 Tax=Lactuca sativa TaxID=4236 RepID=A0A9R1XR96_LACSA|nr:hypothetical protein LSAT_V11C100033920 [Lactuca sativa]
MIEFKSLLEDFIKKAGSPVTYEENGKPATKGYGSISQLCDVGYKFLFNMIERKVDDQKNATNDIYVLDTFYADNSLRCCLFSRAQSHLNWLRHKRLSHLDFRNILKISRDQLVRGIPKMHDHGTEFRNSSWEDFCSISGISHNFSIVRTPQQNGIAERRNKTLIEAGRTMCVIHKTILSLLSVMGKLLKGRKPDISYFYVFGCVCYILNQRDQCLKFEGKFDEGVFLGYSSISKAFRVFNLLRQTVEETSHVTFDEDSFINDEVNHPTSIMNELTYSPLDLVLDVLPNDIEHVAPNVDQFINLQLIFKDQLVIPEEAKPSNQEDSVQSNTNESSNLRIFRDHLESQTIRDVNSRILTCSRVSNNFYMFVNFV